MGDIFLFILFSFYHLFSFTLNQRLLNIKDQFMNVCTAKQIEEKKKIGGREFKWKKG